MKPAIILGGALSVWDELELARQLAPVADVIASNHAARDYEGDLTAFVTMHPEILPTWIDARRAAGRPDAAQLWTAHHRVSTLPLNRIRSPGGSSGLLCVMVALHLGYDRIMLCGVPMGQNGCHYDQPEKRWREAAQYLPAWERAKVDFRDRVRSFGGYTLHMLGAPTQGWIDGPDTRTAREDRASS